MRRPPPSSTLFPYTTLFRSTPPHAASSDAGSLRSPRTASAPAKSVEPLRTSTRSEEHTSELQSRLHPVCRLPLEKKKRRNGALEHKRLTEVSRDVHLNEACR